MTDKDKDGRLQYEVPCEDSSMATVRMPLHCTCAPIVVIDEKVVCSGVDGCPVHGLGEIEEEPGFPWEVSRL